MALSLLMYPHLLTGVPALIVAVGLASGTDVYDGSYSQDCVFR